MISPREAVESNPQLIGQMEVKLTRHIPIIPSVKQRAFLWLPHAEALYGGAAGGGKSVALLAAALQYTDVPGYAALLLRRTFTDLRLPRALLDLSHEWLEPTDAKWNDRDKTWVFPIEGYKPATLTFGFLEVDKDKYRYQSAAFQFIGFDELTQFTEAQYTYMFSRRRRMLDHPVPVRVRAATNPGGEGHDWVHRRFLVEGKKKGRVFISARMEDNPYLDQVDYMNALQELDPVNRERLAKGNWDIRPQGNMFKLADFKFIREFKVPWHQCLWVRYWDLAAGSGPDKTAGVLIGLNIWSAFREIYIADVVSKLWSSKKNQSGVRKTALKDRDKLGDVRIFMEQEPASSGKTVIETYITDVLPEFSFAGSHNTGDKVTRSVPFSAAVANHRVYLVEADWNPDYMAELMSFPSKGIPDDQVDATTGGFKELNAIQPQYETIQLAEWVHL